MKNYTEEALERFLEDGHLLGFKNEVQNPKYLGWIILQKQKPDERYLSLLDEDEEMWFRKKQEVIVEKPYVVQVIELEHSKYESEDFQEEYDKK